MDLRLEFGVYPRSSDERPLQSLHAVRAKKVVYFQLEPVTDKPMLPAIMGATCQREQKETTFGIGIGVLVIA